VPHPSLFSSDGWDAKCPIRNLLSLSVLLFAIPFVCHSQGNLLLAVAVVVTAVLAFAVVVASAVVLAVVVAVRREQGPSGP